MHRTLILFCGWMGAMACLAMGQVAAPSIIPATADVVLGLPGPGIDPYFTPVNPAVMSWNKRSVFGVGVISAEDKSPAGPLAGPTADKYSGYHGGVRWGGGGLMLGLEAVSLQSQSEGLDFKHNRFGGAVSVALNSGIAMGIGADALNSDRGAAPFTVTSTALQTSAGVSFKSGKLFAGVGIGRDHSEYDGPGGSGSGDRAATFYGVGLFNATGTPWHLEYSVVDKGDYIGGSVNSGGGYTQAALRAEIIAGQILLAYVSYSNQSKSGDARLDGAAVDAGWVPQRGIAVTARLETATESTAGVPGRKQTATVINLANQF